MFSRGDMGSFEKPPVYWKDASMKTLIIFIQILLVSFGLQAKPDTAKIKYVNKVNASLELLKIRVYDGDTFFINIGCDFSLVCENMPIRVAGIDTPELRGKEKAKGLLVRDYVKAVLGDAKIIELKNLKRGKYFRIVADVYVDGKSLAELLLKEGYAVPYDGGRNNGEISM